MVKSLFGYITFEFGDGDDGARRPYYALATVGLTYCCLPFLLLLRDHVAQSH